MTDMIRPSLSPLLVYRDPKRALRFLEDAFGFETRLMVDDGQGGVIHSESWFGDGLVMVFGPPSGLHASPLDVEGRRTGSVHLQLESGLDALCERARAAGAIIDREPEDQAYGDRVFTCRDFEGHSWSFGQTVQAMTANQMTEATGHKVATSL